MLNICFDYSPAYELLASAYLYLHPASRTELGAAWMKHVKSQISGQLADEMKDKRLEVLHRLAVLAWQCPDKTSADAFLNWLESLTVGEVIERMIPWVNTFKGDMALVKERIVRVLRGWNEEYFSRFSPDVLEALQRNCIDESRNAEQESPEVQFERISRGMILELGDQDATVVLVPQYHLAPHYILDFYENGLVVCQYPVHHTLENSSAMSELARISTALGDEYRLKILSLVSKRPTTFTEIVQSLQLNKSLVSYHITQLRLAGLLEAHYRNGRLLNYQLRKKQVRGFSKDLLRILDVSP